MIEYNTTILKQETERIIKYHCSTVEVKKMEKYQGDWLIFGSRRNILKSENSTILKMWKEWE